MPALVIDIESAGEPWENIDEFTQSILVKKAFNYGKNDEDITAEELAKQQLGLSPLTGEIVALGVMDSDTGEGAVYFQAPKADIKEQTIGKTKLQPMTEKEMLVKFWQLAERYREFVTYSGRSFDMPFIMLRSAIHGVKPTKDITRARYIYQQAANAVHIDLYDQLTFYGAAKLGSLHMVSRAFGLDTSKTPEIDGSMVTEYFNKGKYLEIAKYNAADIEVTRQLYDKWRKLLAF